MLNPTDYGEQGAAFTKPLPRFGHGVSITYKTWNVINPVNPYFNGGGAKLAFGFGHGWVIVGWVPQTRPPGWLYIYIYVYIYMYYRYTVCYLLCCRLPCIFISSLYTLCSYLVQGTTYINDIFSGNLMLLICLIISRSSYSLLPLPQNIWAGGCVLNMTLRNVQLVSIALYTEFYSKS